MPAKYLGKEAILRLHPDLAGRLAEQQSLTQESTAEQKAAGLDTLSTDEKAFLKESNERCLKFWVFANVTCKPFIPLKVQTQIWLPFCDLRPA